MNFNNFCYKYIPHIPKHYRELQLKFSTKSECNKFLHFIIHDEQICTFERQGIGACNGDSGESLIYNEEIIGIGSLNRPCTTGIPDVYTRVYSYLDFIESVISHTGLPECSIS
ncbi:PREDICTED: chymotrypsin-2-like [Ceratosolen solmsi marchali]|uniref:Chymotrypsin-2-like n=1 Tax=Ceratosolen solmsi marchali TaxID=326594 RepID=A0AAJ7E2P3_9HYME|nr:PREDICTED: chymotrypsin-2-like [Ceratosolen solmsi marchali]